jgi:3',5'-cyclic-AMP phosphodiesterase
MSGISRRRLLGSVAALGVSSLTPLAQAAGLPPKRRALRLAHLTDPHILDTPTARNGLAKALGSIYEMQDRPELILGGGDIIMDSAAATASSTQSQWRALQSVLQDFREIPIRHCLGNHYYWWGKGADELPASKGKEGAKWALDELRLERPYYAYEQGGWRFLVVESTEWPAGGSYRASLGGEQMDWLKQELEQEPDRPTLILGHIPIISACGFFEPGQLKDGNWVMPGSWMHVDAMELKNLFWKHRNVKLCLSGHMHQVDLIEFNGVRYYCSGALSGAWWKGTYYEADPGYAIVDLYEDGTSDIEYVVSSHEVATST